MSTNVAGPLLFAFVLSTLLEAQRRGFKRLYFLARDGQILTRIAEIIVQRLTLGVTPVYLHASRQALFLPALDPDDPGFNDIFVRLIEGRTPREVARTLAMPVSTLLDDLPRELFRFRNRQSRFDATSACILAEHARTHLRSHIDSLSRRQRRAMLSYFGRNNLLNGDEAGIVDVGWRGNLQLFMARALKIARAEEAPRITGFYFGLMEDPPAEAGELYRFVDQANVFSEVLVEVFCAATHGSTWAYDDTEKSPGFILDHEVNNAALDWGVDIQQQAIILYAETMAGLIHRNALDLTEAASVLARIGTDAFIEFRSNPSREEAEVYGTFLHADNPTHDNTDEIGRPASLASALLSLLPWHTRHKTGWAQATLVRSYSRAGLYGIARSVLLLRSRAMRLHHKVSTGERPRWSRQL